MTAPGFRLIDEPVADHPDYEEDGCQCPPDDKQFLLEIEEGQAVLVHAACGRQPPSSWGDWHDLVSMAPIPVTVTWKRECDGSMWHGDRQCDDDSYVVVEPTSVPQAGRDRCIHVKAIHDEHHAGPVADCPWCTRDAEKASRAEEASR
jgi:hypothetical protein